MKFEDHLSKLAKLNEHDVSEIRGLEISICALGCMLDERLSEIRDRLPAKEEKPPINWSLLEDEVKKRLAEDE